MVIPVWFFDAWTAQAQTRQYLQNSIDSKDDVDDDDDDDDDDDGVNKEYIMLMIMVMIVLINIYTYDEYDDDVNEDDSDDHVDDGDDDLTMSRWVRDDSFDVLCSYMYASMLYNWSSNWFIDVYIWK